MVCGRMPSLSRWRKWQDSIEAKRKGLVMLERRALLELQKALDAAGQVGDARPSRWQQLQSQPSDPLSAVVARDRCM